ncbi:MAG TPA: hypothetical protein VJI32_02995 [Candidatus Nanoarchaeia archaeon]|nr:hypothetical protein [Candidatus Nanoarchaeia archaeon]
MISKQSLLGVALAALLTAGAEDCSKKEAAQEAVDRLPAQIVGKIIGYNSHEPLCGNTASWEVEEGTLGYKVKVCVPFRDNAVPNWSTQDDNIEYRMTLSRRPGPDGAVLTTADHQGNTCYVVNLDQIAAIGLPQQVTAVGTLNLSSPAEKNLCPDGERLYGLKIPPANALPGGHQRILFCDTAYLPFDQKMEVTAKAIGVKDQVGRPVYEALDVKILEEL